MSLGKNGYKFPPLALIFLVIDVMAITLLWVSAKIQMEIWNVLIPISLFGLLFWYLLKNRKVDQVNIIP